jgi:hypothetical protein
MGHRSIVHLSEVDRRRMTLGGTPTREINSLGGSFAFNGSDTKLHGTFPWGVDRAWSVSCWFNVSSTAATQTIFSMLTPGGNYHGAFYGIRSGKLSATDYDGGLKTAASSATPTTGVWHHAVFVAKSASSRSVYLDFGDTATETTTCTFTGSPTYPCIAAYSSDSGATFAEYITGSLRDFRFYRKALSPAEVWNLYSHPYDLYASPRRKTYFMPTAAPTTYPSRLLLLGVG